MNFINLTGHEIRLNNGRIFYPSGEVARVTSCHSNPDTDGIMTISFGEVVNLPAPDPNTIYIVSAIVASAAKRHDVVSPATGHPECVRLAGQIWSVPGFVRANKEEIMKRWRCSVVETNGVHPCLGVDETLIGTEAECRTDFETFLSAHERDIWRRIQAGELEIVIQPA